jgi:hypothetical protein
LLFFFAVSGCFSLLLLAVFRCYFAAMIAKSREIPRLFAGQAAVFSGRTAKTAAAHGSHGLSA